ncbi:opsin [Penaeus vannamei]|uniref:Opsin n=1 Tax=Penaeus vannamei TaxID=6689 RepID=A0A3R7SP58_PENVA|nr:opsin [Penaeus vannamei]
MTVTLWFMAWTPYFVINWGGMFNKPIVTPLFSIWGSVFAKANAVYNPIVYAISHPKYRAALEKKLPCLACATDGRDGGSDAAPLPLPRPMSSSWNSPVQDTVLPSTNPYGNYTVVDTVPENMLHMVHAHWYQFPPMNPLWYGLLGFWMTVMGTLSVAGNFVVIWVFMNTKSLRTPANLLVVNLAISDFFMMLTMTPPLLVNAYWEHGFSAHSSVRSTLSWVLLRLRVHLVHGLHHCRPIQRHRQGSSAEPLTSGGAMMRIAGTWAFTLAWCLPPFFGWNRYVPEGNMLACGTDYLTETELSRSYLYVYSVWVYLFPLAYIIYSYTFIVKAVAAHEKGMRNSQEDGSQVSEKRGSPEDLC